MNQKTLLPMCPWVSIDEFVELRMADFHSYPLGPDIDITMHQFNIDYVAASIRESLERVQSIAAFHGLTLKVRGRVDLKADTLPAQFLFRSADGSTDVAIDGYAETGYWLQAHRLAKPARDEAVAISAGLAEASVSTRRAGRL